MDRAKAVREHVADARSSGSGYDPGFEGTRGTVIGRPCRALLWSAREARFVWWHYQAGRAKWLPEGADRARARRLRIEVSEAHGGRSVEEVLADRLGEVA